MKFQSRADWGARPPTRRHSIKPNQLMFLHHTVGTKQVGGLVVRNIQRDHQNRQGWTDIAYNWLVDEAGTIYQGRGWFVAGGATKGWNTWSHSIAYMGNSMTTIPSNAALKAIKVVIAEATRLQGPQTVRPHNAAVNTLCPGTHLEAWLRAGRPTTTTPKEIANMASWQDEPAFDLAIQAAYETTGPNRRTPSGEERDYWLRRFNDADDPAWLIAACKNGLRSEPAK